MDPLNPIKPSFPSPRIRPPEGKVNRREPGTGKNLQRKDNKDGERHNPASDDHQIDELV
jgi:hypothetical protein